MKIDILSLFPEMFTGPLNESIVGKAVEKGLLNISVTDFRDYTTNKQHHVDDTPYGGGAGMLLQAQPIFDALDAVSERENGLGRVILLDPAGKTDKVIDVLIKDGFIAAVEENIDESQADEVIDASGCMVMPGLVDLNAHFREPGLEHKETIRTGSRAAA